MKRVFARIISVGSNDIRVDVGLLLLRLAVGPIMMLAHGLGKLNSYSTRAADFSDPLGVGAPTSLALAVFAEFFCSIGITSGFLTRLSAIPLLTTMLVAGLVVHAADPWGRKELAVIFGIVFLTLLIAGPGRFSIDYLIGKRMSEKPTE